MATNILELKNISKTFKSDLLKRNQKVLIDISCSFETGVATAVLGHNGAGKTTSLRIILGLLKQDSGQVLFRGKPIINEDRRNIGYMPETNKLPAELKSPELLYFHLNLFKPELKTKEKKELVDHTLNEVGLFKHHRNKKISQLSKGLGRRLAWAMASIHDPQLLILDEPFTGMDPLGRKELSEWITARSQKGSSVLLTSHDLKTSKELCSQFVIFKLGSLVYHGPSSLPEEDVLNFYRGVL